MKTNKNKWMYWLPYALVILCVFSLFGLNGNSSSKTLSYDEFMAVLENKTITSAKVSIDDTVIDISGVYEDGGTKYNYITHIPNTEEVSNNVITKLERKVTTGQLVISNPNATNIWMSLISSVLPIVIICGMGLYLLTKMNAGNSNNKAFEFSKSRARLEGDIKVRFTDVAGCEEEKEEVSELIDYLKAPKRFKEMGAKIPKGILMVGSPGTGKTLLAKAVAGEANVPFYSISGSDFVEMFVGVGASRVRDMFKKAKATAPCIIFIDEIDAVGRQRGAGVGGGNDEREQTLNQLLVEMDGIGENAGILIIAATNRPDILDPALLRPGRFDRQITVSLPDRKGRKAILEVHARNKKFEPDIDLDAIAARTPGFSGADLANVLNEAAIMAVRGGHKLISKDDIDEAVDRVMAGPAKKSRKYSEEEKRMVAIHESGHAVIGLFLKDANVVQKVTIIPRGMAGGYNLMTPKEERMLSTKQELIAQITSFLGGRVAEELVLGEISTGASNDIEQATKIAREMVMSYGMSSLGPIQYEHSNGNVFLGRDYASSKDYSAQVAYEIDSEVRSIIDQSYNDAKNIITEHREVLNHIVDALVERETLTKEDLDYILANGALPPITYGDKEVENPESLSDLNKKEDSDQEEKKAE